MRAWVIKTGEPVPFLPGEQEERLFRAGQIVRALVERDHDVTWWTSQFYHQKKCFRDVLQNTIIAGKDGAPNVICLGSRGYRRHVGVARFFDHWQLARNFGRLAPDLGKPDIIVCAWPTIELADAAVKFGQSVGCPVVVDIRDLWPDIIYEKLNRALPFKCDGFLLNYEAAARRTFQGASAATGLSQGMIDWARRRFGGTGRLDRVFHQSMTPPEINTSVKEAAKRAWKEKGIDLDARKTRLVWSGSLVPETDAETLLDAAALLNDDAAKEIEIIICGKGSLETEIRARARRLPNLKYGGWVDATELATLTEASHIGLLCYLDRFDFRVSVPNKVVDYCAASMRVLTNIGGEVPRLLESDGCLIKYPTGDSRALASVLTRIATNPHQYRKKHPPSRTVFEKHFDARRVQPDFCSWLEEMTAA